MLISSTALALAMARARIYDRELCLKAGVPIHSFSKIKSGRRNPKPATIGKLAHALGISVEDLLLKPGEEQVYETSRWRRSPVECDRLLYTVEETAKIMDLTKAAVYALTERPDFPCLKVGEKRKMIPVEGLRVWINEQARRR